jgi:hypothetical protein
MGSGSDIPCAGSSTSKGRLTPFAQVMVTLSKKDRHQRIEAAGKRFWKIVRDGQATARVPGIPASVLHR